MMKAHLLRGVGPEYVACHATTRPCRYGDADHKEFKSGNALAQYNAVAELERDGGLAPEQDSPLRGDWNEVRAGHGVTDAQYEALMEKLNDDVVEAKRERADRLRGWTPTTSIDHDADLATAKGRLAQSLAKFLREPSKEGLASLKTSMYEALVRAKMSDVSKSVAEAAAEFAATTQRLSDSARDGDTDGLSTYTGRMNQYQRLMRQYMERRDGAGREATARVHDLLDEPPFTNMNSAKAAARMVSTYIDGPTDKDEAALVLNARRAAREYLATDEVRDRLEDALEWYHDGAREYYDEDTGDWTDDYGRELQDKSYAIEDFLYPDENGYEPDRDKLLDAVRPQYGSPFESDRNSEIYDNISFLTAPGWALDSGDARTYFEEELEQGRDHGYSDDEYDAIQNDMYHYSPSGKLQTPKNRDELSLVADFRDIRDLTR